MKWIHKLITVVGLVVGNLMAAPPPASVVTFFDQHCADCHDEDIKKAGLNVFELDFQMDEPDRFAKWQRIFDRVRNGEMPPNRDQRPPQQQLIQFLDQLKAPLVKADEKQLAEHGRVNHRRLTRLEYEQTMHELLGIDIPLVELLPEDAQSHGFETVASAQQLSHHQMGRYLEAADHALEEAFTRAIKGDSTYKKFYEPKLLSHDQVGNNRSPEFRDGKCITWPMGLQFTGRMPHTKVKEDGWYRVTLHEVQALNPRNGVVWGTLRSGSCVSSQPVLYPVGIIDARAQPKEMVFEAWIRATHMLEFKPNDSALRKAPSGAAGGNVSFVNRELEKQGFSGISITGLTIERIYPKGDHLEVRRRLFGTEKAVEQWSKDPSVLLDQMVADFARRAFRRPVTSEQLIPYLQLGQQELEKKGSLLDALRASYRAVLCSPRFLSFIEPQGELDDHGIANRLSYALWVCMPDKELSELADQGKLKQKEVLKAQIERLLDDPKSQRFVSSFTDQWLKLKEIDFTNPDPKLYPQFDPVLQDSMVQETRAFITELIQKNLPARFLVDADFTFLNERLARHYYGNIASTSSKAKPSNSTKTKEKKPTGPAIPNQGISKEPLKKVSLTQASQTKKPEQTAKGQSPSKEPETVKNKNKATPKAVATTVAKAPHPLQRLDPNQGLQKVKLEPGDIRGGLISQASILKVTADGNSTSPVIRGVFVNERILGVHLPPPPPGVEAIEPDIRGASSIRAQLEKHRSTIACATCHYTIDPPGLALESFDPIGVWRKRYGLGGKGVEIDPSGITPDGQTFQDFLAWKQLYAKRGEQLGRAFAEQFLTYATGAPLRFSERDEFQQFVASTSEEEFGLRSLIKASILSGIFHQN